MSFVTAALIGAGGALLGGMMSSNGASSAAAAQSNAANQANATQLGMYNQTRADQTPWRNAGGSALGQMAYMMGLPGYGGQQGSMGGYNAMNGPRSVGYADRSQGSGIEGWVPRPQPGVEGATANGGPMMLNNDPSQPYDPSQLQAFFDAQGQGGMAMTGSGSLQGGMDPYGGNAYNASLGGYGSLMTPFSQTNWQQDPGYAFRLAEGQKALERSGSARGMTLSGAQAKALQAYGQNMASQEYGAAYGRYNGDQSNQFNRLAAMAGIGQTANAQMGAAGANYANQVGSNYMNMGNGQAGAALASGNGWQGAINSGLNSWNNANQWNALNRGSYGTIGGDQTTSTMGYPGY